MIVVIGLPSLRPPTDGRIAAASGLAAGVARAAVTAGATVQLVGKIGDDPTGDALVLALARDGIGHVALLRDPAHPTPIDAEAGAADEFGPVGDDPAMAAAADGGEPEGSASATAADGDGVLPADRSLRPSLDAGDVELALRYQSDFRVVVLAEALAVDARSIVFEAASFAGAHVIELLDGGRESLTSPEPDTAFERPEIDPDGAFATLVGRYAAAVDAGVAPAAAFADASRAAGWERASSDE